ncbi:Reverse transcriptase domain-containing protein [Aphis craccivora]|uniref:Reverse transcriptase domain-containing protein n=1 Tax=Aphis craccivora TaxID=307492 RepID=A0A6G0Z2V1_APHCR|nr:Reverse transcriptase domain-containing protein [Aphis craccivora]
MQQKTRNVVRQDTLRLYLTLNVNKRSFKRTKQFKYLWSIAVKEKLNLKIEITTMQSENKCLYVLPNLSKLLGLQPLPNDSDNTFH